MSAKSREVTVRDLSTCPYVSAVEAGTLLGSYELFQRCVRAGWIKSAYNTGVIKGQLMYRNADLYKIGARLEGGESPPALPRKDSKQ